MTLVPGTKLGPYEIVAPLGAGGMGEVWRARDPRLGREVAIKALPATFAQDPERVARFEREAKLLASLSHANVGGIHGLEESGGARYLVLELVEGETLAARLTRGALPPEEALEVCRQVAAALEAAHEAGIIHRDLKPGNVMLTAAGGVKVLDFGLAKGAAAGASSSNPSLSASPTLTCAVTGAGVVLGTAAYMSPEQARGKPVDKRTDIWSLGCVLYECLTGRQAFEGETISDLIARILEREPDLGVLPSRTPARARELLARCLEKDARRRLRDVGDARIEIEAILALRSSGVLPSPPAAAAERARPRFALVAGAVAVAAVSVTATLLMLRPVFAPQAPPLTRFEVRDPEGVFLSGREATAAAISPDGRTLAFVASDSAAVSSLWLRPVGALRARVVSGTEGAGLPFWSPDGRWLAFFADGKLKKIGLGGGTAEVLCDAPDARGASWGGAGVILFSPTSQGPVFRVAQGGGDPQPVTTLDTTRGETAHRFPRFLPDGRRFLFSALPERGGKFDIYLGTLGSPERRRVLSAATGVEFAPPGYLLFGRNGALVAQRVDARTLRPRGEPLRLDDTPCGSDFIGAPVVTASGNGTLAYVNRPALNTRLVVLDRPGGEPRATALAPGKFEQFSISPDGKRAALTRGDGEGGSDLWIAEPERGTAARLTAGGGTTELPIWSPDGSRVCFMSSRGGRQALYLKAASGATAEEAVVVEGAPFKRSYSWSPDGRFLVFGLLDTKTGWDLWVLPLQGDRKPVPYLRSSSMEQSGTISPDGRWMAYESDESGRAEVYVQSFPTPGAKHQVTTTGGLAPSWTGGGRQLTYGSFTGRPAIMTVDVRTQPGFEVVGAPRSIAPLPADLVWADWTGDLSRAFALVPVSGSAPPAIVVVSGWPAHLQEHGPR